ncbi:MAG: DNA polymerase III subunit gamma/tau [bacterium]
MSERRVLTLKYRPQTFAEIIVQDHVRDTLARAVTSNRVANAYLFAGPRGVGKTSTARILAKCLNCLESEAPTITPCGRCAACTEIATSRSLDVLEIDGASSRGIDEVRGLRESIKYAPAGLRFKVYIIDEVHMLTEPAFNALLKTLEEPPAHARFIFATTEGHLVPATIISRCQRFDFRRATPPEIAGRLRWLADQESIKASDAALLAVARRADGAIRDGESILEQLATYRPEGIELADVTEMLGLVPAEVFTEYTDRLLAGDVAGSLRIAEALFDRGFDVIEFYSGLVRHLRDLAYLRSGAPEEALALSAEERTRLAAQSARLARGQLVRALEVLLRVEDSARHTRMPRILLDYLSLELIAVLGPDRAAPPAPAPAAKPEPAAAPDGRSPAPRGAAPHTPAGRKPGAARRDNPPAAANPASQDPAGPAAKDDLLERMRRILGEVEEDRRP